MDYDLFGVVVFRGVNRDNGHYISYVLRAGQWYLMDDEKVISCSYRVFIVAGIMVLEKNWDML